MANERYPAASQLPHAEYARKFLGDAALFIKEFRTTFPPETKVWHGNTRELFGTTVGGVGVYVDDSDMALNLHVKDINGQSGTTGIWNAADVIRIYGPVSPVSASPK